MYKNMRSKRTLAVMLVIVFVLSVSFSAVFILSHGVNEHDHNGSNGTCAACIQLSAAQNLLKQLGIIFAMAFVGLGNLAIAVLLLRAALQNIHQRTPISLKERINN